MREFSYQVIISSKLALDIFKVNNKDIRIHRTAMLEKVSKVSWRSFKDFFKESQSGNIRSFLLLILLYVLGSGVSIFNFEDVITCCLTHLMPLVSFDTP